MKKLLIFDYNGVLVDDLKVHEEAFMELAKRHDSKTTRQWIIDNMHTPSVFKTRMIIGSSDKSEVERAQLEKENIYIELANKKGVLFPETRETLERLAKDHILSIVSNSTQNQISSVFPKDLLDKFRVITTYEDIEKPKPDPSSLNKIMEKLGIGPEGTAYVGDSPTDMKTAKNAGVKAIGIDTGNDPAEALVKAGADVLIHSLKELEF